MADEEIVQYRVIMKGSIQQDSGKTLRLLTIRALFPLSIFTEPLQRGLAQEFHFFVSIFYYTP